jgi:hypothetical protein
MAHIYFVGGLQSFPACDVLLIRRHFARTKFRHVKRCSKRSLMSVKRISASPNANSPIRFHAALTFTFECITATIKSRTQFRSHAVIYLQRSRLKRTAEPPTTFVRDERAQTSRHYVIASDTCCAREAEVAAMAILVGAASFEEVVTDLVMFILGVASHSLCGPPQQHWPQASPQLV